LIKEKRLSDKDIIIYCTSVGSGPSTYLASKHPSIPCLVLEAPFLSITQVKQIPWVSGSIFARAFEMFDNFNHMKKVNANVMIIHGMQDEVVPFEHGRGFVALINRFYKK